MRISNRSVAKDISAALLAGEEVGFQSIFPCASLPKGVSNAEKRINFTVTPYEQVGENLLPLHPKVLTVGIGCKKGTSPEQIFSMMESVFHENRLSLESIEQISSIDLKREEEGILALAERWSVPFKCFPAEMLNAVHGSFSTSDFVHSVTGVDNVCERSAVLASGQGTLLVPKTACNGVTVAVAMKAYTVRFE